MKLWMATLGFAAACTTVVEVGPMQGDRAPVHLPTADDAASSTDLASGAHDAAGVHDAQVVGDAAAPVDFSAPQDFAQPAQDFSLPDQGVPGGTNCLSLELCCLTISNTTDWNHCLDAYDAAMGNETQCAAALVTWQPSCP